jgi:hypothetical protein
MCPELCCLWVKFGFIIDFCNGILWFFGFEIWACQRKNFLVYDFGSLSIYDLGWSHNKVLLHPLSFHQYLS